jgi:hypothetical protein
MENRKLRKAKKHIILCVLHEINFEEMENRHMSHGFYESDQPDLGLALHEVKEKVQKINDQIGDEFLISVEGLYAGDIPITVKPVSALDIDYVKNKIVAIKGGN